jgi:hypothetical protein
LLPGLIVSWAALQGQPTAHAQGLAPGLGATGQRAVYGQPYYSNGYLHYYGTLYVPGLGWQYGIVFWQQGRGAFRTDIGALPHGGGLQANGLLYYKAYLYVPGYGNQYGTLVYQPGYGGQHPLR